jgi:hypothetical protein
MNKRTKIILFYDISVQTHLILGGHTVSFIFLGSSPPSTVAKLIRRTSSKLQKRLRRKIELSIVN